MEEHEGVIDESSPAPDAASGETTENGELENSETQEQEQPEVDETQEQPEEKAEESEESQDDKLPANFRDGYKALEADVKKYKPLAQAVEDLGGLEVIEAIKPLAELLSEETDAAQVVRTLQEFLPPQHLESVVWSALDNAETQQVVLNDPDVRQIICDTFFEGRSIEEIQDLMSLAPDESLDPETAQLRQELTAIKSTQQKERDQLEAQAAQTRTQDLEKRFFVDTAEDVVKQFNLVAPEGANEADKQAILDTVEDLRFAAQGRFLAENSQAYLQIQDMYAKGLGSQARIAEARLHSKWQATLIKTAERQSQRLQAYSEANKLKQEQKTKQVRPDVSGRVEGKPETKQEAYDPSDPDFLTKFMADFKRDAGLA